MLLSTFCYENQYCDKDRLCTPLRSCINVSLGSTARSEISGFQWQVHFRIMIYIVYEDLFVYTVCHTEYFQSFNISTSLVGEHCI